MSHWMRIGVFGLGMGFFVCGAFGQAFPIRAVSEPVYPDEVGMESMGWEDGLGTMERVGDVNGDGVDDLVVLVVSGDNKLAADRSMWLYFGERVEDGSVLFGMGSRLVGFDLDGETILDFALHDHDGDGLDDLVIVDNRDHDLDFWISTGGGFVEGAELDSGTDRRMDDKRLLIADIDQDGNGDYLVSNDWDEVGVWTNRGGQVFSYEAVSLSGVGGREFFASDLDQDGDLDLIVSNGDWVGFVRQSDDGWSNWDHYWQPTISNFEFGSGNQIVLSDVNGDGYIDLVLTGEGEDRRGLGFVLAPFGFEFDIHGPNDHEDFIEPEPKEIPFFEFPDFGNEYSYSALYQFDSYPRMLRSVSDLDGDGTDDLVYYPFEGLESGWQIFDPLDFNSRRAIVPVMSVHGEGAIQMEWEIDTRDFAYREAWSDVNGDGVKDRLMPTFAQRVVPVGEGDVSDVGLMVWGVLGNPFDKGVVVDEQDAIGVPSGSSHVVAADLDGDDDPEILVTIGSIIKPIDRNEEGYFAYNRDTRFSGSPMGFRTVVALMDDDETPDVLSLGLSRSAQAPSIFLNPVAGAFGETVRNFDVEYDPELYEVLEELGMTFDGNDNSFSVGDVNGDGILDIVIRGAVWIEDGYSGESVLTWINDGMGGLSFGSILPIRDLSTIRTFNMELVDVNHDGLMDVVSVGDEGIEEGYVLGVYVNDGTGAYSLVQEILIHDDFGLQPYWMEIEDLDGDGYEDVMVLIKDDDDLHEIVVVYGSEVGLSDEAVYLSGGNAAEVLAVDLDGDGLRDLLSCSYQSSWPYVNSVSIVFQREPRVFEPIVSINDIDLSGVNVADMNGDGMLDLIACGNPSQMVRVFYSVPGACVADLNLDGVLNYFDVSLFVRLLSERREIVDFSQDGEFGVLDVTAFLDAYADGCEDGGP